jgi:hypothetical protein
VLSFELRRAGPVLGEEGKSISDLQFLIYDFSSEIVCLKDGGEAINTGYCDL